MKINRIIFLILLICLSICSLTVCSEQINSENASKKEDNFENTEAIKTDNKNNEKSNQNLGIFNIDINKVGDEILGLTITEIIDERDKGKELVKFEGRVTLSGKLIYNDLNDTYELQIDSDEAIKSLPRSSFLLDLSKEKDGYYVTINNEIALMDALGNERLEKIRLVTTLQIDYSCDIVATFDNYMNLIIAESNIKHNIDLVDFISLEESGLSGEGINLPQLRNVKYFGGEFLRGNFGLTYTPTSIVKNKNKDLFISFCKSLGKLETCGMIWDSYIYDVSNEKYLNYQEKNGLEINDMCFNSNNILLTAGNSKNSFGMSVNAYDINKDKLIWEIKNGKANKENDYYYTGDATSIIETSDNNYIFTGESPNYIDESFKTYGYIAKIDEQGNIIWQNDLLIENKSVKILDIIERNNEDTVIAICNDIYKNIYHLAILEKGELIKYITLDFVPTSIKKASESEYFILGTDIKYEIKNRNFNTQPVIAKIDADLNVSYKKNYQRTKFN